MPKRRKKKFAASKQARRMARETIGLVPPGKILPDKRRQPPKHKPPAGRLPEP